MAELTTVARPYANAVFAMAKRDKQLSQWSRALDVLAATAADPRVHQLIESPEMANSVKAQKLIELCGDELDDRGRRLVRVLAENDRLDIFAAVAEQFELLKAEEERILDVEVISAHPLTGAEEETLRQSLRTKYEREVALASRVDPALIGGAIIRAGDTVIDGSVKGKLDKLAESLMRS